MRGTRWGFLLAAFTLLAGPAEAQFFQRLFNPEVRVTFTYKDKEGQDREGTRHVARTQVDLSASVQAVDCATGKVYSSQRLVANPFRENASVQGQPAYPSSSEVKELALREVCPEVRRMLLSWQETRKLIFYDDKDYGMKEAYFRLQAEDVRGALALSQEAFGKAREDRKAKTKDLSRTSYNLGMCQFILGDYDAALPNLKAAHELEPGHGIFRESLQECQRALRLRAELARVEGRAAVGGQTQGIQAAGSQAPGPLGAGVEERLERLERLKQKGLVTPREYEERRRELLKEL